MSLKGFSKALSRAPQQFRQKFNMGEATKDTTYDEAEAKFKEIEKEITTLNEEAKRYSTALRDFLQCQIGYCESTSRIYDCEQRKYEKLSESDVRNVCLEYIEAIKDLQVTLEPELDLIEERIVKPTEELLVNVNKIRKVAVKRDHKRLDYDRRRATLKKLREKKEKKFSEEKALYQAELRLEEATNEFEYYNETMKTELPQFFKIQAELIKPLFQSFYYIQLSIFWTLKEKSAELNSGNLNLNEDIHLNFEQKRGNVQERIENLGICRGRYNKGVSGRIANVARKVNEADNFYETGESPPSYHAVMEEHAASSGTPPPILAPRPNTVSESTFNMSKIRRALYDFVPQAEGDLQFSTGDEIEVIESTPTEDDWWTGSLNGKVGTFPANYTEPKIPKF